MHGEGPPTEQPFDYPTWQPPSYNVTRFPPRLLSQSALDPDPDFPNNFSRTGKWCADGSSLMVQCENRSFQMYKWSLCTFAQPAPIVDFIWYPSASRHNLPSYCFVATVRECPVKLLDGRNGGLRASYPIVDHRERYIAPHTVAFNLTANKLYCGFEDAIEIFDVQRPGEGDRLQTTPSKKSKDGLKGIISTITFSLSPEYYAAGSLTPASPTSDNIGLFNESALGSVLSIGGVSGLEKGGVTQLMFSPTRPHILYASFRRSEKIWGWDLRGDASSPLYCLSSAGESKGPTDMDLTNQKTRFDIESTGKWLVAGNQTGKIMMYDLGSGGEDGEGFGGEVREIAPVLSYEAHGDVIGAVAFHPLQPVLLSVSGSRHFNDDDDQGASSALENSDSDSSDDWGSDDEDYSVVRGLDGVRRLRRPPQPSVRDASISVWDFGEPGGI
ncbi:hypothetical protein PAXRUDRAFT_776852 [Paxillus rubicundulus Ve08.2h10]|uniref:Uncharacterized protein n=1 Tax=Paxillus rubicundulus Ve08.2h10 TaxID=930991 RepID=A0A0D0DHW6_9AGAM|nr:hypothetical protein PAXRUDRAFT_776852 [Paxillus rubicundulus Ve08.2h10]